MTSHKHGLPVKQIGGVKSLIWASNDRKLLHGIEDTLDIETLTCEKKPMFTGYRWKQNKYASLLKESNRTI